MIRNYMLIMLYNDVSTYTPSILIPLLLNWQVTSLQSRTHLIFGPDRTIRFGVTCPSLTKKKSQ